MDTTTVFIGGVHGVGKTYFCNLLSTEYDIEHVTASSLIGRHIQHAKDKTVPDIKNNQAILAEELYKFRTHHRTILIDGHFCLLDKNQGIQSVPLGTFEAIAPRAIILLHDDPAAINSRLSVRDGNIFSEDLIAALQENEMMHAQYVSKSLDVPLELIEQTVNLYESIKEVSIYFK